MIETPRIAMLSFAQYHANFWTEAFLDDGKARVTCVWDDNAARGREAAARFGLAFEPQLDKALANSDAVAICSENATHLPLTRAAAAARRAILCEKPTARTVAEIDAMAQAVSEAGVLFMQSFPKRFDPASHTLKQLIADGRLGQVHFVRVRHGHFYGFDPEFRSRWYVDPELGGGGALLDEGIHGADLLHWFFGMPDTVTAEIATPLAGLRVEQNASAIFRYADGMLAELTASFIFSAADASIEIYGTRGTAILSGVDLASRDITAGNFLRVSRERDGVKEWEVFDLTPRFKLGRFHHQNAIGFLACLREGKAPPAGIADGRAAQTMIEAAYRAAHKGRRERVVADGEAEA
jgi:predicted dehydrogenase